ncbi:MAG: hypothetical protein J2P40_03085 [Candidatus Dormibacteraeota bacterium]|nr:hypothetical protein [Candidatus Dormibacteraeota bacterium]
MRTDEHAARSSVEIPFGFPAVRTEMLRSLESWFHPLLQEARAEARLLEAEVGLGLDDRPGPLHVEVRDPYVAAETVAIPFRVGAGGVSGRWPVFDSVLTAAWFGDRRTQLVLAGRYGSPEHLDEGRRALLQRLVDAVGGYFVTWVGAELGERLGGVPAISSPPRRRRTRRIA